MPPNKKTPKKTKTVTPEEEDPAEFNLMDREDFTTSLMAGLEKSYARKKRAPLMFDQSKIIRDDLPLDSLYFQWAIDNRGIEKKTLIELLGQDQTGKSSLLYWMAGNWMPLQVPMTLLAGEDKFIKESWAQRCLSKDPELAAKMVKLITVIRIRVLDEIDFVVKETLKQMRDPNSKSFVPRHIPVVIAIDLMNKIATANQAAGMETGYGDYSKDTQSDLGDRGHNWDRAKAYHDLINRFNLQMADQNVVFVVTTHQNDEAVGGKSNPFSPVWQKNLSHRTKTGGQATNQTTALQMVVSSHGNIYCDKEVIAKRVALKPFKNSYGGDRRTCNFAIVPGEDANADPKPGLRWDLTTVEWFAEKGFYGMKRLASSPATAPLYSCEDFGLRGSNILEAAKAINDLPKSDWEELGRNLKIPGYVTPIEDAVKEITKIEENKEL